MLIFHVSLALAAVGALSLRSRSAAVAAGVLTAGAVDAAFGADPLPALQVVAPLLAFLAAALTLAALVERAGLAERAAHLIAVWSRGRPLVLYALACGLCALLTAIVSLDGAVVLVLPVLLVLTRDFNAPFRPLFLGAVVTANAVSIAVPQGNPTNLVVIGRLGLSPAGFLVHMALPGLAAASLCAAAIAYRARGELAGVRPATKLDRQPLSRKELHAAAKLVVAGLAAWLAPFAGIAPWWPFAGVVAAALVALRERPRLFVPWRIGAQVTGLLLLTRAVGLHLPVDPARGLPGLLLIASVVGAASALANNLPVSAAATALLSAGPTAYAASIGLAVGALAAPQGSVATLIAIDLAGSQAPTVSVRSLAPLAAGGVVVATLLLWSTV